MAGRMTRSEEACCHASTGCKARHTVLELNGPPKEGRVRKLIYGGDNSVLHDIMISYIRSVHLQLSEPT